MQNIALTVRGIEIISHNERALSTHFGHTDRHGRGTLVRLEKIAERINTACNLGVPQNQRLTNLSCTTSALRPVSCYENQQYNPLYMQVNPNYP